MRLRTDDDIYRARLVYLGPPGYTLPFQWTYAQYGLFAVLVAAFLSAAWVVTGTLMSSGLAVGVALFATGLIWRYVDPDQPARKVIQVALTDWRAVRPRPERLPRLSANHVRFTDHTGGRR